MFRTTGLQKERKSEIVDKKLLFPDRVGPTKCVHMWCLKKDEATELKKKNE